MTRQKTIPETRDGSKADCIAVLSRKPRETFWLAADPLTGERFDVPAPTTRTAIPVYDAETGELREFLLP